MKTLLILIAVFNICTQLTSSKSCNEKKRFTIPHWAKPKPNTQIYSLRLYEGEADAEITVEVNNAFSDGISTTLEIKGRGKPKATLVSTDEADGKFTITLTDEGKAILAKKLKSKKKWALKGVVINMAFHYDIPGDIEDDKKPKVLGVVIGTDSCLLPTCDFDEACNNYFERTQGNDDHETGVAEFPFEPKKGYKLKIGFSDKVQHFEMRGRDNFHYKGEMCQKIYNFEKKPRRGSRAQPFKFDYTVRYKRDQADMPYVSYIEYSSNDCKSTCGTKPTCEKITTTTSPKKCIPLDPEGCGKYFNTRQAALDHERGDVKLPGTTSSNYELMVGFDERLSAFELSGDVHFHHSECGQIFHFKSPDQYRGGASSLDLTYVIRVLQQGDHLPSPSYIRYKTKDCESVCGVKPVCPPTTAPPTTTTGNTTSGSTITSTTFTSTMPTTTVASTSPTPSTTPEVLVCDLFPPCEDYFMSEFTREDSQVGFANLKLPKTPQFKLKIGFAQKVVNFELQGDVHAKGNECSQIFNFEKEISVNDFHLKFGYTIRFERNASVPVVSYIEYESMNCDVTCGVKPVCPTTPPTTTTTTTDGVTDETDPVTDETDAPTDATDAPATNLTTTVGPTTDETDAPTDATDAPATNLTTTVGPTTNETGATTDATDAPAASLTTTVGPTTDETTDAVTTSATTTVQVDRITTEDLIEEAFEEKKKDDTMKGIYGQLKDILKEMEHDIETATKKQ